MRFTVLRDSRYPPITFGDMIHEEFMKPLNLSIIDLAYILRACPAYARDIVEDRVDIDEEDAGRLSEYFGTTKKFWLNLRDGIKKSLKFDAA